ncbi:endonuclease [Micromonospora sp. CPCC 205539]|uniref:endonuclease n=1 Tax=Micromonospora sp. CPCC 205539 TaxID=3122408 RepID=UPI002FF41272
MPSRPRRSRDAAAKPAGKIVRKAAEKLDPPKVRVTGPDHSLPTKVIRVQRKDIHATAQFRRKMAALKKLSDEGKLYKATNPVERDTNLTDSFKERIRQRIWDKYWPHDKDLANRLSERLSSYHPDHVWELQLGGPDTLDNIKLLHGKTNTDIGLHQIWPQIRSLPDGTPIRIEVVD